MPVRHPAFALAWIPAALLAFLAYAYFDAGFVLFAALALVAAVALSPLAFHSVSRRGRPLLILVGVLMAFVAVFMQPGRDVGSPAASELSARLADGSPAAAKHVRLERVIDGDTIVVHDEGADHTIRLIGIDAPEERPTRTGSAECYGKEASIFLEDLLNGAMVRLEADPTQADTDRYGRLLRHVFMADGTNVGARMVRGGFALAYVYQKPDRYADVYRQAEREAQADRNGLWQACGGIRRPLGTPAPSLSFLEKKAAGFKT